ncbi:MAG: DNA-3-methyladenine glycosylase family protein [Candidatus Thalassarchaeaceae archaeon]
MKELGPDYWEKGKKELKRIDKNIKKIIELYEFPSLTTREDIFFTLIRSIVGQQISVRAADTIWDKVVNEAKEIRPEIIYSIDENTMRNCGLSKRKVEYMKAVSERWLNGYDKINWHELSDEAVIEKLVEIRGIGKWTAEMILIFTLMRPDIFPMGDIGAIRALEKIYNKGQKMNKNQIEEIVKKWEPWRTIATWYLWRSIDPEPVQY